MTRNRKSTFKVSSRRRPLHQRLTPLAWAMVGVTTLAVGLAATLGVMSLTSCSSGEVWQPTPTATPIPTDTPAPTPGPSPTPTVWYEGMVSPTPEPEDGFPAWWSDEMTQDDEDKWWPPDDVREMVIEHYLAAWDEYESFVTVGAAVDLDGIEETRADWYSGPMLDSEYRFVEAQRAGDSVYVDNGDAQCIYEVQEWSADGLESTLGIACQNVTLLELDPATGELLSEIYQEHSGLRLIRMRYDPDDGHWKQHEFITHIPVEE